MSRPGPGQLEQPERVDRECSRGRGRRPSPPRAAAAADPGRRPAAFLYKRESREVDSEAFAFLVWRSRRLTRSKGRVGPGPGHESPPQPARPPPPSPPCPAQASSDTRVVGYSGSESRSCSRRHVCQRRVVPERHCRQINAAGLGPRHWQALNLSLTRKPLLLCGGGRRCDRKRGIAGTVT